MARKYRAIARYLLVLERDRGIFDMDALTSDPEAAISASSEVSIEYDPSPHAGCSVFGYYRFRTTPPSLIIVHPSMTSARDRFTILHELGHHIQRQHLLWANVRYSIRGLAGDRVEERVSDAIAAEVLIPSHEDEEAQTISATSLSQIHSRSRASRSAVAMRAIEVAPESESAVVSVVDSDGVVIFARAVGDDIFSPARGLAQPGFKTLIDRARENFGVTNGPLNEGLNTRSGWVQHDLTADLALDYSENYAFVVLRPTQRFGREPVWENNVAECLSEACGTAFNLDESVQMCVRCTSPKCPECSSCSCEQELGAVCNECFMGLSVAERSGDMKHECQ